eukprot:2312919-Amphidinium_carterae.1
MARASAFDNARFLTLAGGARPRQGVKSFKIVSMLLYEPRQVLACRDSARSIKHSRHNTVEEQPQRVRRQGRAIFLAFGGFPGTQMRLDVSVRRRGGDTNINADW